MHTIRITVGTALLMLLALIAGGCLMTPASHDELPPVLSQEELIRPYETLGRIQVTREVYLFNQTPTSSDVRAWGYEVIREEAAKMKADAVILPEVTGHTAAPGVLPSVVMPSTEYRATGVAIKFK